MRSDDPSASALRTGARRKRRKVGLLAASSLSSRAWIFGSAIDAYLDHLRVERALAANSVTSYATDLAKLAAFAEEQGSDRHRAARSGLVTRFLVELDKAACAPLRGAASSAMRGLLPISRARAAVAQPTPPRCLSPPRLGPAAPRVPHASMRSCASPFTLRTLRGPRGASRSSHALAHVRRGVAGQRALRAEAGRTSIDSAARLERAR